MQSERTPKREKAHRLPREAYQGEGAVAFTACITGAAAPFADGRLVQAFVGLLGQAAQRHGCTVPVYCFMPDHVHLILQGTTPSADLWRAMVEFKQRSGFWLRQNRPALRWQKDFHDHVIRRNEDLGAQVRYVANNPVRKGLASNWADYPFTGAIGVDLQAVVEDAVAM